ncbi:MAG: hypothetical protein AAFV46_09680, partial [Cyanobacteria bacterium J06635_11]
LNQLNYDALRTASGNQSMSEYLNTLLSQILQPIPLDQSVTKPEQQLPVVDPKVEAAKADMKAKLSGFPIQ